MPALPSTTRREVPDLNSREWIAHHDTVYNDARVTSIDTCAAYTGETSHDNGQTWQPRQTSSPRSYVYGHHVLGDVMGALLTGHDAVADGPTRTIRERDGSLTRWALRT